MRGWRRSCAAAIVLLALVGCSEPQVFENQPQPAMPGGFFALAFDRVAPPGINSVSALPEDDGQAWRVSVSAGPLLHEGLRLEPTGETGALVTAGRVYVHASFRLHNDGDEAVQGLVLLGYGHEDFRAASAISQAVQISGAVASDLHVGTIKPTHRLSYDAAFAGTPEAFVGRSGSSDFVALPEGDVPALDPAPGVVTVFPYGFLIGGGDAILPGAHGDVHVAFAMVTRSGRGSLQSFVWNAVLVSLDGVGVTQAPEENHGRGWAAALQRATDTGADRLVAIGPGVRLVPDASWCDRVVGLTNVRIAGTGASDGAYVGIVAAAGPPQFQGCEGASP